MSQNNLPPAPPANSAEVAQMCELLLAGELPNERHAQLLAAFFAAFADPTRLRLIAALRGRELCVHELCELLGLKQSSVSQHLKQLWQAGILRRQKVGLHVFYACVDEHISEIFTRGLAHVCQMR